MIYAYSDDQTAKQIHKSNGKKQILCTTTTEKQNNLSAIPWNIYRNFSTLQDESI